MKKVLLLILTFAYCFVGISTISADPWVITKDGKMDCRQVSVKYSKALIILQDGSKISMPLAQINSYSTDSKLFNRLSLYQNGKPSGRKEFMQLLSTREDYCLYKYYHQDAETPYYCYYIYKGDQLCYSLDETMAPSRIKNLFQYFGFRAELV